MRAEATRLLEAAVTGPRRDRPAGGQGLTDT